ncbi:MAG: hypothetical protein WCF85_05340 [Rhodospirillaceae bacterium]
MNVEWVEGEVAGGKAVFGVLDTGFTIAIFRQRDGSVWFSAALPQCSLTIDPYRMPILWVDDTIVCDAGETAELTRVAEREVTGDGSNFMPYHMVGDTVVGFRLWHGVEAKGLGCIRTFLDGTTFTLRYFVRPQDSIDINIRLVGLSPLLRAALDLRGA